MAWGWVNHGVIFIFENSVIIYSPSSSFFFPTMEVNCAPKQPGYKLSSKYLPLCSAEQRNTSRFGTTWGWVNDDRIFIFGWSIALRDCLCFLLKYWIISLQLLQYLLQTWFNLIKRLYQTIFYQIFVLWVIVTHIVLFWNCFKILCFKIFLVNEHYHLTHIIQTQNI